MLQNSQSSNSSFLTVPQLSLKTYESMKTKKKEERKKKLLTMMLFSSSSLRYLLHTSKEPKWAPSEALALSPPSRGGVLPLCVSPFLHYLATRLRPLSKHFMIGVFGDMFRERRQKGWVFGEGGGDEMRLRRGRNWKWEEGRVRSKRSQRAKRINKMKNDVKTLQLIAVFKIRMTLTSISLSFFIIKKSSRSDLLPV